MKETDEIKIHTNVLCDEGGQTAKVESEMREEKNEIMDKTVCS